MMPLPKISIVTPSYNQGRFLEEALNSVKAQNYQHIEHLVLDGGSTDDSVEILKRMSAQPGWEHLQWTSGRDRGQGDALNQGFRRATGEIIGWLNSDDAYASDCFQSIAGEFAARPKVEVLYGDYDWIDELGRRIETRREIEFNEFILFYNRICILQSSAALFLRRSIFDSGYFLDEKYHYAMDYEFYLRLAASGIQFQHIPRILGSFRWHTESKSTVGPETALKEFDEVQCKYAPALQRLQGRRTKSATLACLKAVATMMRWAQKMSHGYYFEQFRSRSSRRPAAD